MSDFTRPLSRVGIVGTERLEETLRLTAAAVEHANEALVLLNVNGGIISVNPACIRMTGYSQKEASGMTLNELLHHPTNRHNDSFFQQISSNLTAQCGWEGQASARRKNGSDFPAYSRLNAIRDDNGQVMNYIVGFTGISQQREYEGRLSQLEVRDGLTGLANRNLLTERTNQALLQAERYGRNLAVLCIGVDCLKEANDIHGHAARDELLTLVAQQLVASVRASDTVARVAADEFVVLLPEIEDSNHVLLVAAKIAKSLEEPFFVGTLALSVGASIGIARYPADELDMAALLRHADEDRHRKNPMRLRSVVPA